MTVTSSNIALTGRRVRTELPGKHTYVAQYLLKTDDKDDGHLTILDSARAAGPNPLPNEGDEYSFLGDFDANSQAREFDIVQIERDRQTFWLATVTWRPAVSGDQTTDDLAPPTERPVRYWIEYNRVTEPVLKDAAGNQILNRAEQPYPEPIVRVRHDPVLVIKRYYETLGEIWDLNETYQKTVNSDVFLDKAAGKWRYAVTDTNEPEYIDGTLYYEAITRIEFKSDGWKVTKREEGWKVKVFGTVPEQDRLVTPMEDGVPLGEPAQLWEDGTWADLGDPPIDTEWDLDRAVAYAPLIEQ